MQRARLYRLPERQWVTCRVLVLVFAVVVTVAAWKDWWLTSLAPNPVFYIVIPTVSTLSGAVLTFGAARVGRQPAAFLDLFAAIVGANIVMQAAEIVLKLVYYLLWTYPGMLYILVVFLVGYAVLVCGIAYWGKVRWGAAAALAAVSLISQVVIALLVVDVTGLTTPGS